jgi:hypothetical protein
VVESFSEDEDGDTSVDKEDNAEQTEELDPSTAVAPAEIQNLLHRKEELERRHRKQERHRQRVQVGCCRLNLNASHLVSYSEGRNCSLLVVIMLAIGPKVCGFRPNWGQRIFKGSK